MSKGQARRPAPLERCRRLAECTEEAGHITRGFLSPPMREVHRLVREWMEAAGLCVRIDAAGNIRGRSTDGPRLMIGSHLDTVPHAGGFDGILGVMIGIALAERRIAPLEIIGFSEEEGVRFGKPFVGSLAVIGAPLLDEDILEAIREYGLDPDEIPQAAIDANVRGFLEFHIEQGPVLDGLDLPLGLVETIAGQSRVEVTFQGRAAHAGTTPMNRRSDALAAAAEWIGFVEQKARSTEGLVATVGRLEVPSGATNVIPGEVRASLDVRHAKDDERMEAVNSFAFAARSFAYNRGVHVEWEVRLEQSSVDMDEGMVSELSAAMESLGYRPHRMVSGAGHDAMILARRVPTAMVFLRSPGGISHQAQEAVYAGDVDAALMVGMKFLESWKCG